MMKSSWITACLYAGAFAFLHCPVGAQTVYLYDLGSTVLDGTTGENTYLVSNSQAGASLVYNGTTPSLTDTLGASNSFTYLMGYFTSTTLGPGESLQLNYTFSPSTSSAINNLDGAFRVGFFNSNTSKLTGNLPGSGNTVLANDRGYAARYRPASPGTSNTFIERTSNGDNLWTSGSYTDVSGSPTLSAIGTGTVTGSFTLTKVPTGIELISVVNGGSAQSIIDMSGTLETFDAFSIFTVSGAADPNIVFTQLSVSTIAVPEPTSYALLVGSLGLWAMLRSSKRPH